MKNYSSAWWRALVWLNIVVQICFPATMTFMPVIVSAGTETHPGNKYRADRTQVYTLRTGETTATVAKKYGMSLPELKKLNQFRIFSTGFENLQPGDDIDVPLSVTSEDNKQHDKDDQQAQQLAGYATQTGSFLASGVNGDAAAAMARGMATGATSAGVQQWLSHFGTARVQLDMDENFSLKNSQFDLLAPLWEQQDMLAFTQGSLHRTDDRTQSSLGFGFRWFSDSWMLGSNTFVDYDLSRDHARAGMGMEYWRDYLKMGANSYLRLTNWKNSPDLNGYEERPADGWDLRTQAWLPALPQLGGKLTYEQYYGNEVALFGKDKRQRDPHAFTFGLDYTPVPLVTLNAEQRQGKAGENDTRFGLALRYQPGTPWRQQVDPDAVAVMRSLAGSRHDLVERNNNIILEYRRKDDIRLRTVSLVTGYAGEKKSLGVSVTSHNGLERIDWSAPALLAAGGEIVQDDPKNYSVVLPAYQFEQGINNYTVTGVAVDSKGHRSNTSETQISVHAPTVSQTSSTFMPLNSALVADGHSSQLLTLTLRSGQGEILDAPVAEISIRPDRLKSATVSEVSKKEPGVYEVTVTAGTDEETLLLTPEVFGTTLNAARITISRIGLSDTRSTITKDKDSVIANDSATVALKFTAKDMNDTPVTGLATQVTFRVLDSNNNAVTGPAVTTGVTSEDKPGVYMASLKGTKAGHYTVIPLYNDQPVGALSTGVDLTPGPVDGENSHFELPDGGTVAADGLSTLTLRFTALDIYGNPVTDQEQKVTFSVQEKTRPNTGLHMDAGSPVTVGATTEQGNGVYTAKLSGTRAGIWTVTPVYDGQVLATLGQDVTLSAGEVDEGQSDFILPGATTAQADGTSPVALKFTAKDMNGNPVAGQAAKVSFRVLNAESNPVTDDSVKVSTATESSPGVYVANISGTKAGDYTVTPVYDNQPLESRRTDFSLTAGGVNGAHSSFVPTGGSTATADGNATVALQFAARDMNNNLVTGLAPQLTFRVQNGNAPVTDDSVTVDAATENSPGVYTAKLKGTKAGEYTVSVLYGGSPVDVQGVKVTLTAGEVDSGASHFDLSGDNTVGDDEASRVKLTFTANDVNGNPVTGQKQKVTFRVLDSNQMEAGAAVTVDTTTEESPGLYTAMLYGTKAGTWTVMPVYDSQALTTLGKVVTLSAGAVDEGKSGFIPTGVTSVPADGTSPVALQFTPADMYGNPVTGQATKVTFRVLNAESHPVTDDSVTVSTATEGSPGVYTANLSGTKAGHYTVIPEYDSQPLTGLHVEATLTAGDMDGAQSVFMASGSSTVPADDSSTVTLQFTAKDMNGNPVTGLASLLAFTVVDNESHPVSSPAVTVGAATEGNDGIYTANLKGQKAGEYTVTVLYNGSPVDDVQGVKVTLTAGEVDKAFSTLTLPGAGSALADGAAPVALQFMARDVNNNPVTDQAAKVTFRVLNAESHPVTDGSVTVDAATESSPGVYTANLKGTKAGEYSVTVLYDGVPVGVPDVQVTLTAGDADKAFSTLTLPGAGSALADGVTPVALRFTANDMNDNPVTDQEAKVSFRVQDAGNHPVTDDSVTVDTATESQPGVYTANLKGTKAGEYTVTVLYDGDPVGVPDVQVTLTAGEVDVGHSDFASTGSSTATADGNAMVALKFTANDMNNNPVTGQATKVTFRVQDAESNPVTDGLVTVDAATESSPGAYTANLKGTKAGEYTVAVLYDGSPVGVPDVQVTLTAGDADTGQSGIDLPDGDTTIADGATSLTLRLTAKDVNGNLVTGQSSKVTFSVPDNSDVTVASTVDEGGGVYTATLVGTKAGTWTVTPEYDGLPLTTLGREVTLKGAVKDIQVNGYTWSATSGFPKTGFVGARFNIELEGADAADYDWQSSAPSWVHVQDGEVTFTSEGNREPVIIKATPKAGVGGTEYIYRFAVNNWFTVLNERKSWNDTVAYCSENGQQLPNSLQLGGSKTKRYASNIRGEVGSLWSEWGDMSVYGAALGQTYWTQTYDDGGYLGINLGTGQVNWGPITNTVYVACVK